MAKYKPIVLKSRDQVAAEFGVSLQTVSTWLVSGMPGTKGNYPLKELIAWFAQRIVPRRVAAKKKEPSEEEKAEKSVKSQLLVQKYRMEEIKYAAQLGELMPREHVRQAFTRSAELYRTAGDLLRKHHGDEAQQILLDAIEGVEKELDNLFQSEGKS